MKDRSLIEICVAVGTTVALVLMISGNWHPPAGLRTALWLCLGLIVSALLVFTEIGRAIVAVVLGGALIWATFTGQMSEWIEQLPDWITSGFLLVIFAYVFWMATDASRKRIKQTQKSNPALSGIALLKQSWTDRERIGRSDEWIKANEDKNYTKNKD